MKIKLPYSNTFFSTFFAVREYLRRRWRRLLCCFCIFALLLTFLLYVYRQPILIALGRNLVYESPLERSDVIVVLSGGSAERLEKGIELLQQGYAPCLLLLLPDRVDPSILNHDGIVQEKRINQGLLEHYQVPMEKVLWSDVPFYSTYGEVEWLKRWMIEYHRESAIVVTGLFQSKRAKWSFDFAWNGEPAPVLIVPASSDSYSVTNWWHHEEGFISVENEYMKSIYYRLKAFWGKP